MVLTDTHTHLYLDEYKEDVHQVISKAIQNNVEYFLMPNIDSSTIKRMNSLCNEYPGKIFPMIGLHPTSVKENYLDELAIIKKELKKRKYYAIGEIGIDLYWDKTYSKEQEYALRYQMALGNEFDLPIVIHTRSSFDEAIEVLKDEYNEKSKGIFHCFGGTYEQAMDIIEMDFFLGIGGVVTFKNSGLDKVIEHVDLEHILLETDAPYLTPSPYRGMRNESSYLPLIAHKIAELKRVTIEEVAEVTTRNARKLFNF
jgi:TatD DNase family protein